MNKQAVSVTLDADNLLWLRARARARKSRSLSAALDDLLKEVRRHPAPTRSVVGTIDLPQGVAGLERGQKQIRAAFENAFRKGLSRRGRRRG